MRTSFCRCVFVLFLFLLSCLNTAPCWGQGNRTLPAPDDYMRVLGKAQTWQVREGEFVVLHYLLSDGETELNDEETVREKIQGIEEVLTRNGAILQIAPLTFKAPIYLFPSPQAHGKAFGVRKPVPGGATQFQTITCVDGPWSTIRSTLTHELAHLQIRHGIADPLPDFLQEGLACYVQKRTEPQRLLKTVPTHRLFFITTDKRLSDYLGWPSDRLERDGLYEHAASWIEFLLHREADEAAGWAKIKAFCTAVSKEKGKPEQGIERALTAVYGQTRAALEKEWRRQIPHLFPPRGRRISTAFSDPVGEEGLSQWHLYTKDTSWMVAQREQNRVRLAVLRWTEERKERGYIADYLNLDRYRGKRIRLTLIAERNSCPMANLFLNLYGGPERHRFYSRMLKISDSEVTYTVTLDVPDERGYVTFFGLVLNHAGEVLLKSFQVAEVDSSIPTDTPDKAR